MEVLRSLLVICKRRLFKSRRPDATLTKRRLKVNNRGYNSSFRYANNYIKTSKYSLITFLPKNLFEQFRRLANAFFLVLLVLQIIPGISSLAWYTTLIPLVFVLAVTAVKDGYDDVLRHRSDKRLNGRKSWVFLDGRLVEEEWQRIQVGDIIRVDKGQSISADLLLLTTSEPQQLCYVETAELDGETNLKVKRGLAVIAELGEDLRKIGSFDGEIVCDLPNNQLNSFDAVLTWRGAKHALTNDQMLLRGCTLRNTKWCYGVVIYAGQESKLMMSSGLAHFKRTSLDGFLNLIIIGIMVFMVAMCLICSILSGLWEYVYGETYEIFFKAQNPVVTASTNFFSYIMLLNTVVPISLYVCVELIRWWHSLWINWDMEMYHEETDTPAAARTTTLNEELGQIKYIFTDKTGTLTQNIMTFRTCSINGEIFGCLPESAESFGLPNPVSFEHNPWAESKFVWHDQSLLEATKRDEHAKRFWLSVAICHTVMADECDNTLEYQSQSPDEAALVSAARNFGYVFRSRTHNSITVIVDGKEREYKLLNILDFDNVRKRMAVLVEIDDRLVLFCKGADSTIFERLLPSEDQLQRVTQTHLNRFAAEGLRTLCYAYKYVDKQWYDEWQNKYFQASIAMIDRRDRMSEVFELMETDLRLIGATAVEDKLQDGVPETITNLAAANIKMWMLTGDKQETAENIGYSCGLLNENLVFTVDAATPQHVREQLRHFRNVLAREQQRPPEGRDAYGLLINGHSLAYAMEKPLQSLLLAVARQCQSVVCCRMTPKQKQQVVDLIQSNEKAVTLAIGDGANDVAMIKGARIGVGISGLEGRQAVLAADFSLAQFRFLQQLLLVHGRLSYYRMTKFLNYFFYKNFAFTMVHFWYAFYCGFSAQTIFDSVFISCYNLFFTSVPVLLVGVFDQDVDREMGIKHPHLYAPGLTNELFNLRIFSVSVLHSIFTSMALFFINMFTMADTIDWNGRNTDDLYSFGFAIFSSLVIVVNGHIALDTAYWTIWNFLSIIISVLLLFAIAIVFYEVIPFKGKSWQTDHGTIYLTFTTARYWLNILLISVIVLLPLVAKRACTRTLTPTLRDVVRVKMNNQRNESSVKVAPSPSTIRKPSYMRHRRQSTRSGFAFSQETGFGELILKGIMRMRPRKSNLNDQPTTESIPELA